MKLSLGTIFTTIMLGVYLALCIPVLVLTTVKSGFHWLTFSLLFEFLALGIALELTELSFGVLLPSNVHPKASDFDKRNTKVAVLYVCCDDINEESLQSLAHLYEMDVFILDDSECLASQQQVDQSGLRTIRRSGRTGYKAGNLNHWLEHYGDRYLYFIILDSDSIMTLGAIWELVAFAEHPDNHDVAIVQSSIYPRSGNSFQRLMGSQADVRFRILNRLHDRIGWSLSHGHNNLHRTKAIRELGGFNLSASCEDTLTSLQLARKGWRIILVDTVSHDSEPYNVFAFRRRIVRWARQTVDVITVYRSEVTWAHAWLMARHLFSYILPFFCISLLAFIAVTTDITMDQAWDILCGNFMLKHGYALSGLIGYMLFISFLLIVLLRLYLFLLAGGDFRTFLLATFLSGAVSSFCSFHITLGVVQSLLLNRTGFTPTGIPSVQTCRLSEIVRAMAIPWIIYIGITCLLLSKPGLLFFGFNLIWAGVFVTTPFALFLFHKDQREDHIRCFRVIE